jgi:hypothetical protein
MIRLKPAQLHVFLSPRRFRILAAGRRFGKTFLAKAELLRAANGPGRVAWYVAPNYIQAKRIVWSGIKEMTRPYWASKPSETDLRIDLASGGTIAVRGADAYDSLRGEGLDFVVLDEFASMAPEAWTSVLRPMLADRRGEALFIGTPKGFNHFYEHYATCDSRPDWAAFRFTTEEGGNVSREELESAKRDMDPRLYQQEFKASFEELRSGRVYRDFERRLDVREVEYDEQFELCWTIDFNVDPACSLLCQIIHDRVVVLDEIVLRNAVTYDVTQTFLRKTMRYREMRTTGPKRIDVRIFGDSTGNSRKSSATKTDWQIIREFFANHRDFYTPHFDIPSENPRVEDRINNVNAKILNAKRVRSLTVSPRSSELIRDLEQVCWKADAKGNVLRELDNSNPKRTHTSDALGYLISRKFPIHRPFCGERPGVIS